MKAPNRSDEVREELRPPGRGDRRPIDAAAHDDGGKAAPPETRPEEDLGDDLIRPPRTLRWARGTSW